MRTVVIPDLHHHTGVADRILAWAEPYGRAVFLGDYFDDFDDTPAIATETARWVKARLADPRSTLLWGNHDLPYAFPDNHDLGCPGFTWEKHAAITAVLRPRDWSALRLHAWVGPWLLSHAGLDRSLLPADAPPSLAEWLRETEGEALSAASHGWSHPFTASGWCRGGRRPIGGLTWRDWRAFEPVPGACQIVGHTPSRHEALRRKDDPGSRNFCLDHHHSGQTFAIIAEDGSAAFHAMGKDGLTRPLAEMQPMGA